MTCTATLSILSQLPPDGGRRGRSGRGGVHFQFFPSCLSSCSAAGAAPRWSRSLSILSQLPPIPASRRVGQGRRLSILSQLPLGYGYDERSKTWIVLSILSQLPHERRGSRDQRRHTGSFNSFPVASVVTAMTVLRASSRTFNSFPVASEGLSPGLAYKLFFFSSEVGKTASHHLLTHEKLLAFSTSEYINPVSKRELLPCSLLKIRLPSGSF